MNRHRKSSPLLTKSPVYRRAFERLDTALARNTPSDNSELIRLMRLAYFADVDELEESGEVKLPE